MQPAPLHRSSLPELCVVMQPFTTMCLPPRDQTMAGDETGDKIEGEHQDACTVTITDKGQSDHSTFAAHACAPDKLFSNRSSYM